MKLIVTVDTEEDNWGTYDTENFGLENIQRITLLQKLFDKYAVKPTYLITHPVAKHPNSIALLKRMLEDNKCEIGLHCHPWNTPPFEEKRNSYNSMLCNLPLDLQLCKIGNLYHLITKIFGITPNSFRAGRWGFSNETGLCLARHNIGVDSSILAFQNWDLYSGPNFSDTFPNEFQIDLKRKTEDSLHYSLLEIPASAGYARGPFRWNNNIYKRLDAKIFRHLHVKGILNRAGLIKKIWLSPETSSAEEMIILTKAMIRRGFNYLNMFFHSTALKAGLSPFVRNENEEALFLKRIEDYLIFLQKCGIPAVTLSGAAQL